MAEHLTRTPNLTVRLTLFLVLACHWPGGAEAQEPKDAGSASLPVVGMVTRDYVDPKRQDWARSGPRPLRTVIWYPADDPSERETIFGGPPDRVPFVAVDVAGGAAVSRRAERYPLIVMSHGTGGSALMLMWLGRRLAANGYIVAAVNHHGNTAAEIQMAPQGFLMYWERPRDLRVAVDRLLADPVIGPRIDRAHIGAAGFSLGGYTVIAAAGGRFSQRTYDAFCASPRRDFTCGPQQEFPEAPARFAELLRSDASLRAAVRHSDDSYRDPRIRAVFAIAPALGGGFAEAGLRDVTVPVEIVIGAADTVTPVETNAKRYASMLRRAKLTVLPGAIGHYTFLHECTPLGRETLPICRDGEGVDRRSVHETVSAMALTFFDRTLGRATR
jgi:predicted dienelactone hydrolase